MTTDTGTGETTAIAPGAPGPLRFRPAGRHRKPRPRRIALAVGGFALAAGVLSLVRLAPDAVTGGGGQAEAAPRIDATDTAATLRTAPGGGADGPSTASVLRTGSAASAVPETAGSAGTTGKAGKAAMETTAGPSARASDGAAAPAAAETDPPTGIPQIPRVPTASRAPGTRAAPAPTAPRAAPSTTAPARTPAPAPHDPGLCVPIIGLCVGGLSLGG